MSLDPESAGVIAFLEGAGWGSGTMRIDFSIEVLQAADDTPLRAFTPTDDFYQPDCDLEPVPVPAGGALEGESGSGALCLRRARAAAPRACLGAIR